MVICVHFRFACDLDLARLCIGPRGRQAAFRCVQSIVESAHAPDTPSGEILDADGPLETVFRLCWPVPCIACYVNQWTRRRSREPRAMVSERGNGL